MFAETFAHFEMNIILLLVIGITLLTVSLDIAFVNVSVLGGVLAYVSRLKY